VGIKKFSQKSIDTLLRIQLKRCAFARLRPHSQVVRQGELTTGKNKNREKIEKSVDALLALR